MKALLPLALLASLSGCALKPLYAGGAAGPAAQALRGVEIGAIEGKGGWLLRNALADRMQSAGQTPLYRLEVELDDQIAGFGVRRDDAVTRERRTLRARYRLVENATSSVLLDTTAGSDAGIDVVSSEYATVAAENSALERLSQIVADQIVTRVALALDGQAAPTAP